MSKITFRCQHCGEQLTVGQHKAGKEGRCGNCGEIVVVPARSEGMGDQPASEEAIPEVEPIDQETAIETETESGVEFSGQAEAEDSESELAGSFEIFGEVEQQPEDGQEQLSSEGSAKEQGIPEAEMSEGDIAAEGSSADESAFGVEMEPPSDTTPFLTPENEAESEAADATDVTPQEAPGWLPIGSVITGILGVATVWFWGIGTLFGTVAIGCYLYQGERRRGWGLLGAMLGVLALILGVCYAGWRVFMQA